MLAFLGENIIFVLSALALTVGLALVSTRHEQQASAPPEVLADNASSTAVAPALAEPQPAPASALTSPAAAPSPAPAPAVTAPIPKSIIPRGDREERFDD